MCDVALSVDDNIESRHRRLVAGAVDLGYRTPEAISAFLALPLWNVRRALHHMKTGEDLPRQEVSVNGRKIGEQIVTKLRFLKPKEKKCRTPIFERYQVSRPKSRRKRSAHR